MISQEIVDNQQSHGAVPKRLQSEEAELTGIVRDLAQLLALSVFQDIQEAPPQGFASLTLLSGLGYGEAYRAITVIRLGLDITSGTTVYR